MEICNPYKKFWGNYFETLFISLRAFLPSFNVLKTIQESVEVVKVASVISEIKVVFIWLIIKKLYLWFEICLGKFKC